jgi:putative N6-adenine-specific DNA methylase
MLSEKGLQRRIKQHIKAQKHHFYAIVHPGFEQTAQRELATFGINASAIITPGGVEFSGKLDDCYRVNLRTHTVSRLLMRLFRFRATRFDTFRKRIRNFPWELYLSTTSPVSFSTSCHRSRLHHTTRLESEAAAGIGERLEKHGMQINLYQGDEKFRNAQVIFVRFDGDRCQISLDTSGELLYRRGYTTGYQKLITEAPLRETIAASILLEAHLHQYDILIDPMCGSGTFSIEAGALFSRRLPGIERDFAFQHWPAFRERAFNYLKKSLAGSSGFPSAAAGKKIICSDRDQRAVSVARENIKQTALGMSIEIQRKDFLKERISLPDDKKALIVMNPPYGARLSPPDLKRHYRKIGTTIRDSYQNCGYAIIVPGIELEKALSLSYHRKIPFSHGGIGVAVLIRDGF